MFTPIQPEIPLISSYGNAQLCTASNPLTPKEREIVQDESKQTNFGKKDKGFFENEMAKAFAEGHRVLAENGIGCVVFAHKNK